MKRSDAVLKIMDELDCPESVADKCLLFIEEVLGMVPPAYLVIEPISAMDANMSFYLNKWEDEADLPVGKMNVPLNKKRKGFFDNMHIYRGPEWDK